MEDEELTDYEKERLERIRANQEMLIKLGLKDKVCTDWQCSDTLVDRAQEAPKEKEARRNSHA